MTPGLAGRGDLTDHSLVIDRNADLESTTMRLYNTQKATTPVPDASLHRPTLRFLTVPVTRPTLFFVTLNCNLLTSAFFAAALCSES